VLLPRDFFVDEVANRRINLGQRRLTVGHLSIFSTRR
jgi:hypothetical protein